MEGEVSCFATDKALQIPCVLQQVLIYLPHADLKQARLVNRVFKEESSRILRKRSKIVLHEERLSSFYQRKFTNAQSFCEGFQLVNVDIGAPSMYIFWNHYVYSLKSLDLRDSKWTFAELKEVLLRASPQIEELIIHGQIPKDLKSNEPSLSTPSPPAPVPPKRYEKTLGRMMFMQPRVHPKHRQTADLSDDDDDAKKEEVLWLPEVKRLDLQLCDNSRSATRQPVDELLQDFTVKMLTSTRNLQLLRSSWNEKIQGEKFHRILFETLIDPKLNITLPELKKIDFSLTPWSDDQYLGLSLKNFPLTYLSLDIFPYISTYTVVKLLSSFKSTLTKLKISFTSWTSMEFPCDLGLDELRHLSLDWYIGSLRFAKYFKKLETLILVQADFNEALSDESEHVEEDDDRSCDSEMTAYQRQHSMLSSFELYQPTGAAILPESVRKLSGMFPNIKKLVLENLTDESLREICAAYPELEELSAIQGTYSDEGVTGISVQSRLRGKQLAKRIRVNARRKHCFIGNLKNLRKLELKAPTLTDMSVSHGILQCKRLRSLTLRSLNLTHESLNRIVDTFNLEYLESNPTFSDAEDIRYALQKMRGRGRTFVLNGIKAPPENCPLNGPQVDTFICRLSSFIKKRPVVQSDARSLRLRLIDYIKTDRRADH